MSRKMTCCFLTLDTALQVWGTGHEGRAALSCRYWPSPAWPCPYSSSPPPPPHPQTSPCAWGQICDIQHLGRPVHISGVFTESALRLLPDQVFPQHPTVQPWLPHSRHSKPACTKCTWLCLARDGIAWHGLVLLKRKPVSLTAPGAREQS